MTDPRRPDQQGQRRRHPVLAYDDAHHLLYASLFSGGVARMVVP
jgi:hypothetical protein